MITVNDLDTSEVGEWKVYSLKTATGILDLGNIKPKLHMSLPNPLKESTVVNRTTLNEGSSSTASQPYLPSRTISNKRRNGELTKLRAFGVQLYDHFGGSLSRNKFNPILECNTELIEEIMKKIKDLMGVSALAELTVFTKNSTTWINSVSTVKLLKKVTFPRDDTVSQCIQDIIIDTTSHSHMKITKDVQLMILLFCARNFCKTYFLKLYVEFYKRL